MTSIVRVLFVVTVLAVGVFVTGCCSHQKTTVIEERTRATVEPAQPVVTGDRK